MTAFRGGGAAAAAARGGWAPPPALGGTRRARGPAARAAWSEKGVQTNDHFYFPPPDLFFEQTADRHSLTDGALARRRGRAAPQKKRRAPLSRLVGVRAPESVALSREAGSASYRCGVWQQLAPLSAAVPAPPYAPALRSGVRHTHRLQRIMVPRIGRRSSVRGLVWFGSVTKRRALNGCHRRARRLPLRSEQKGRWIWDMYDHSAK